MRRFESHYQLTDKDRGDAGTFNSRLKDLDERLNAQEELRAQIEGLQQTLLRQAATRMDEVLLPALERIREIQSGGFLVAHIAEGTAVSLVEGPVSIAVDQNLKTVFRPTPFLALVREDSADDWAIARALGYDDATGVLDLDVLVVAGQPGPFEDLIVAATGGGVAGQMAFLERTRDAADGIADMAGAVSAHRDAVAADRLATGNAREAVNDAVAAFGQALAGGLVDMEALAERSEAAAERAEQVDLADYFTKSETLAKLEAIEVPAVMRRSERSDNDTLVRHDAGSYVDIVSGTFTQTFDPAATLGNGWWCYIRNSGAGEITLNPSASEHIDGLVSYVMYPGEVRVVQCDGAAFRTIVLVPFLKIFTTSGNFVRPPGYAFFEGDLLGGGGAGGKSSVGSGGGGGACVRLRLPAEGMAAVEPVVIAARAPGQTENGFSGLPGNSSSFCGVEADGGGGGGGDGVSATPGGIGGAALRGGVAGGSAGAVPGGAGGASVDGGGGGGGNGGPNVAIPGGRGGGSVNGGGGGGGPASGDDLTPGGTGGASINAGRGGDGCTNVHASGGDGVAPGGGGGAARGLGLKGGDGARGELRIWGVC